VLAFAQDPADWVGNATTLHRATCDGKGRFRLTQLLSGRYLVVAAEGRIW
jgi:hypothetical protein